MVASNKSRQPWTSTIKTDPYRNLNSTLPKPKVQWDPLTTQKLGPKFARSSRRQLNILQVPKLWTFQSRPASYNLPQILSPQAETQTTRVRRQNLKSPQASNSSSQVSKASPQARLSVELLLLKSFQKSEDSLFKKSTRKKKPPSQQ